MWLYGHVSNVRVDGALPITETYAQHGRCDLHMVMEVVYRMVWVRAMVVVVVVHVVVVTRVVVGGDGDG